MLCGSFTYYIKYNELGFFKLKYPLFFFSTGITISSVSAAACYSYLQSTTQLNCICIIYYSYSEVWSLQEFFEEKAIFQDFAAYWESERKAKKNE